MADKESWHLSKSVPISLIFAIFIQTAGVFWWASGVDAKVAGLMKANSTHSEGRRRVWNRINAIEAQQGTIGNDLARLDAGILHLTKQVDRLVVHMIDRKK
jgi:hypothetical protein